MEKQLRDVLGCPYIMHSAKWVSRCFYKECRLSSLFLVTKANVKRELLGCEELMDALKVVSRSSMTFDNGRSALKHGHGGRRR